jgi:Fur family transcriptional regulator, ferric uptake regulator
MVGIVRLSGRFGRMFIFVSLNQRMMVMIGYQVGKLGRSADAERQSKQGRQFNPHALHDFLSQALDIVNLRVYHLINDNGFSLSVMYNNNPLSLSQGAFLNMMERNTSQRRAIQQGLQEADRPLSPDEVLELALKYTPRLGIATVYRTLKEFAEEGWVSPVHLAGQPVRYEIAGKVHHHYFFCRECNKTYEVKGCPGDLKKLAPRGFTLERHDLILYGLCAACTSPA